jgi:hypothetical protein
MASRVSDIQVCHRNNRRYPWPGTAVVRHQTTRARRVAKSARSPVDCRNTVNVSLTVPGRVVLSAANRADLSCDDQDCPDPARMCRLHSLRPWGVHLVVALPLKRKIAGWGPARDRSTSSFQLVTRRHSPDTRT